MSPTRSIFLLLSCFHMQCAAMQCSPTFLPFCKPSNFPLPFFPPSHRHPYHLPQKQKLHKNKTKNSRPRNNSPQPTAQ
ncbi:hypothetical protein DL98DRAFT_508286 [Cadophora sp. DSE1049]|nr:hypothetical protein DL98DRAFT_508286 [Cadophora sp. DSE1049]